MKDSENNNPSLAKFLTPIIFLYASFSFVISFNQGFLALLHLTIVAISGFYLLRLLGMNLSAFKVEMAVKIIISALLLCITAILLLLTNYFSI